MTLLPVYKMVFSGFRQNTQLMFWQLH